MTIRDNRKVFTRKDHPGFSLSIIVWRIAFLIYLNNIKNEGKIGSDSVRPSEYLGKCCDDQYGKKTLRKTEVEMAKYWGTIFGRCPGLPGASPKLPADCTFFDFLAECERNWDVAQQLPSSVSKSSQDKPSSA